jgi:hypothetical protein
VLQDAGGVHAHVRGVMVCTVQSLDQTRMREPGVAALMMRFPDGQRFTRRFLESHTFKVRTWC